MLHATLLLAVLAGAPIVRREPRWPPKTRRALLTDDQIALARRRIAERPEAARVRDNIVAAASRWLNVPFDELTWRIPDARVPRAFDVSANGSPTIGREVYQRGTYPWKLNFDNPFQITCPITGQTFPSGDFLAYYRGGMTDRSLLSGDFPDDGWGWVAPDGERYWLVAHACHWHWQNHVVPGVEAVARAYVLTGELRYAHQAAAMLARIADVYPAMDHEHQSRYGSLHPGYSGKIVNHIWECGLIRRLAAAYDLVWEAIDADTELQRLRGQTGAELRQHIETNLLQEGIDSIFGGKIRGNYGMHQQALAVLVAVRQPADGAAVLARLLDDSGAGALDEGVRYALYNWVHRDGVPLETAPGYNLIWTSELTDLAELLEPAGVDLWSEPQFRRLVEWPAELTVCRRFTPAIGDSGDVRHGLVGRNADLWRPLAQRGVGRYSAWMLRQSGGAEQPFRSFESLVAPELEPARLEAPDPAFRSRVLDGYGMALLTNPAETVGVICYYGQRGGHGHRDGLHLDLYAHGRPLTPDTGYPDAMNAEVPGIFSWSKATVCHNTVTIDARQQNGNAGGQVLGFVSADDLQFVDLSAPGNYQQAREYRRQLLLVSVGPEDAYLVDVFRVAGGTQHDFSLHGATGERSVLEGTFGPVQERGTLAGDDVEVGEFYDDAELAKPGRHNYGGYSGSGFQHLVHVQRQTAPVAVVTEIVSAGAPATRLRIHVPAQDQEVILAEAQVSPVQHRELLPYLLCRRTGENLESTFVTVLEPFRDAPLITRVERLPAADGEVALRIVRPGGVDAIRIGRDGGRVNDRRWGGFGPRGAIVGLDPLANRITVRWDDPTSIAPGEHLFLGGDGRRHLYRVVAVAGDTLMLDASLRCGRGRVQTVDPAARTVTTDTRLMFQPAYRRMWLTDGQFGRYAPIAEAQGGKITIGGDAPMEGWPQGEFWIVAAAPGDPVWRQEPLTVP